jgi:DNA-binding NarL/FixJ family response regulator
MAQKRKLVIAEDHKILREGLKSLLKPVEDLEIVGEAPDGLEAIRCVERYQPELLLLDLSMPGMSGLAVIRDLKSRLPEIKILVLTIHESEEYVLESLRSGVNGYCLKDASYSELLVAIKSVLDGKQYLSPGISDRVLTGFLEGRKTLRPRSTWDMVTEREREVLKLVGEGYRNKEIAEYLYISAKTVEKHRSNLMRKLDVHTASALTSIAFEKGLIATAAANS